MNKYHKIFNRSTRRTGGPSPRTAPRVLRTAGTADCGPAAQHWQIGSTHALRSVLLKWVQKLHGRRGSSREAIDSNKALAAQSCIHSPIALGMSQRPCGEYVVQHGDTVVRIAEAYGTLTSNVITQERQYPDPYKLFPGQKLFILERDATAQTQHRLVAGETLQSIAQQHRISLQALEAANTDAHPVKLVPGSFLRLPNDGTDMKSKQETKTAWI